MLWEFRSWPDVRDRADRSDRGVTKKGVKSYQPGIVDRSDRTLVHPSAHGGTVLDPA
jgi:hypothetical protein